MAENTFKSALSPHIKAYKPQKAVVTVNLEQIKGVVKHDKKASTDL